MSENVSNLHSRIGYLKSAPYFFCGGIIVSLLIWKYRDATFPLLFVIINCIANTLFGLAIIFRYLKGNKWWIFLLYGSGIVPLLGIINGISLYGKIGAFQVLALSVPFWYLPQIIFRNKMIKKIEKDISNTK